MKTNIGIDILMQIDCEKHNKKGFCLDCHKIELYAEYGKCDKCDDVAMPNHIHCPKCGSPPSDHEVRNYDMKWHDGDVHCTKCETYVRGWDAG